MKRNLLSKKQELTILNEKLAKVLIEIPDEAEEKAKVLTLAENFVKLEDSVSKSENVINSLIQQNRDLEKGMMLLWQTYQRLQSTIDIECEVTESGLNGIEAASEKTEVRI